MAHDMEDDTAGVLGFPPRIPAGDEVCRWLAARLERESASSRSIRRVLAARDRRWRSLCRSLPGILLAFIPSGTITMLDGMGLDSLGIDPGDHVGKPVSELFRRLNLDEAAIASALAGVASVVAGEVDGRTFEFRLTPVFGPSCAISEIVGCATEISERVLAERNLRTVESQLESITEATTDLVASMVEVEEARDRLASIVEATTDLVAITDAHGRACYLNPAGRLLLGYRPDQPLGGETIPGMDPARGAEVAARFVEASRRGTWRGQDVWTLRDGRRLRVSQVVIAHRAKSGTEEFFSTVVRDTTEQMALESQLRHAQKMEAMGRLAGGVAHDFNNLLTVFMISSGRLLEYLAPGDPGYRHAREIRRGAERAAALTGQLLAFSRKQRLEPTIVDLREVVRGMLAMLESLVGEGIMLTTYLDADVPPIEADRGQIEQVIVNIAVNARDAMPAGGNLIIEVGAAVQGASSGTAHSGVDPGRYVVLSITDTGTGMDAESQSKIFEPFFTTKPPGMGTGLGLATSYGIVKQSGGTIDVYSEPERGSTFKIYLPARDGANPRARAPDVAPGALAGGAGTVLLVEDDDMVRRLIHDQLVCLGYDVFEAPNGKEALALLGSRDLAIDLLLTDVVMPVMGGPALSRVLAAVQPGMRTLFMSGYTANSVSYQGLVAAGASFIHKPFSAEALSRAVRDALANAPAIQAD